MKKFLHYLLLATIVFGVASCSKPDDDDSIINIPSSGNDGGDDESGDYTEKVSIVGTWQGSTTFDGQYTYKFTFNSNNTGHLACTYPEETDKGLVYNTFSSNFPYVYDMEFGVLSINGIELPPYAYSYGGHPFSFDASVFIVRVDGKDVLHMNVGNLGAVMLPAIYNRVQ